MNSITRSGRYYRVADPQWTNPLDARYSVRGGGRWNPQGTFAALHLNQNVDVAKANAKRLLTLQLEDTPLTADDLEPSELPILVTTAIPQGVFLDALSVEGCEDVGLPASYPLDASGTAVGWSVCQPIGRAAYDDGLDGVACLGAASDAPLGGEELARFERPDDITLEVVAIEAFVDWYGSFDW